MSTEKNIYVIGHRNPDTDSICSAIAYANLKNVMGAKNVVAARAGSINKETKYALDYFRVAAPQLVSDIYPRVSDIAIDVTKKVKTTDNLRTLGIAMKEAGLRSVPVVDEEDKLVGMASVSDLAKAYFQEITLDSVSASGASIVDIEQIVLAINKSGFNILPAGTAAAASVLSAIWLPDETNYIPRSLPKLPKLIISGSATGINSNQIEKLKNSDDSDNIYEIGLTEKNILEGVQQSMVDTIVSSLGQENTVLVHSSYLVDNFDGFSDDSLNAELTRTKFASRITDFLAELTKRVIAEKNVLLVTLGGETSYKCCRAIDAMELSLIDEVLPAIPLCIDRKDQLIITKSGNLGNSATLIDIVKYINRHEQL